MGIDSGSPSQTDRANTSAVQLTMKATVTSLRAARLTTRPPRHAIRNAKNATLPHWPGDTHTSPVVAISAMMPRLVGLKMCLPPILMTNLLETATTAAADAISRLLVRSSRQSESPEMSALRASKAGSFQATVQAYWVTTAVPVRSAAQGSETSKSRIAEPYASRAPRIAIW